VLIVAVILTLIGLVMVFSASGVVAGNRFHDAIYFLKRQIAWLLFGFILLRALRQKREDGMRRLGKPDAILAMPLLVLFGSALFTVLGQSHDGSPVPKRRSESSATTAA